MAAQGPAEESVFVRRLTDHFGRPPATLPIITETFEKHEHPNVHLALEDYLARDGRSAELLGILGSQPYASTSLSDLVAPPPKGLMGGAPAGEGPVQFVNI